MPLNTGSLTTGQSQEATETIIETRLSHSQFLSRPYKERTAVFVSYLIQTNETETETIALINPTGFKSMRRIG